MKKQENPAKQTILLIDSDSRHLRFVKELFSGQYDFKEIDSNRQCLLETTVDTWGICAVFIGKAGGEKQQLALLQILNNRGITGRIPVIVLSFAGDDVATQAIELGAVDVISPDKNPVLIKSRVKQAIELFEARNLIKKQQGYREVWLKEKAEEVISMQRNTIEMLSTAIEFRDIESGQHTQRIYDITKHILLNTPFGEGYSTEEIEKISVASYMHDIGKIAVSDMILKKPGKLSKDEYNAMKSHTVKGARFIRQIPGGQEDYFEYARDIALHHHERWDGSGYPEGLKGDEISVPAQVVSIADAYDALINPRIYKKPFSPREAVEMIKNGECGVFNPELVECFIMEEENLRKLYENEVPAPENIHGLAEGNSFDKGFYDSSDIANDLLLLTTAVQSAYDMIICANLTRNSYYMIDYDSFLTKKAESSGVYDRLISRGASTIPPPDDKLFSRTFDRLNLLKRHREGKTAVSLFHPQYTDDGNINMVETTVHFVTDPRNGYVLEITLARYI